ncbi:gamma-glutamylaminecyclotransferase-like isoform X1, partial [Leptotrombidium deliense]
MPSNETVLFVYGTLKRGQPNHRYLVDRNTGYCRFVSEAKTEEKWPLVIASKYNIPYLLNTKGVGKRVHGEVYYVDEKKLKTLDEFEGYPEYYEKFEIAVELYSFHCEELRLRKMFAWAYILTDFDEKLLKYDKYEKYDAYGEHGLYYVQQCERNDAQKYNPLEDVKKESSAS